MLRHLLLVIVLAPLALFVATAHAELTKMGMDPQTTADQAVTDRMVSYEHEGIELEGYLAYPTMFDVDNVADASVPAVMVVPEWWGLNDRMKGVARRVAAEQKCVVFVADMYGKGKVTDDPEQAKKWAGPLYSDREMFRARAAAARSALLREGGGRLAPERIAAIGYCFGGAAVLELAYSGADLAGVVSIHGGLMEPQEGDAARVQGQVMILHGAADPMVKMSTLTAVTDALSEAEVPWTLTVYSGAKHAFTNPQADEAGMDGVGYQERAAEAAWRDMNAFLDAVLTPHAE